MIFGYKPKPNFAVENEAAIPSRPPWISQRRHRRPRRHRPRRATARPGPGRETDSRAGRASLHPDGSGTRVSVPLRIAVWGLGSPCSAECAPGVRAEVGRCRPRPRRVTDLTGPCRAKP